MSSLFKKKVAAFKQVKVLKLTVFLYTLTLRENDRANSQVVFERFVQETQLWEFLLIKRPQSAFYRKKFMDFGKSFDTFFKTVDRFFRIFLIFL